MKKITDRFCLTRASTAALTATLCLATASDAAAQVRARSLIEYEIEAKEAKTALTAAAKENSELRERLEQTGTALADAQKNLSFAMSESEVFKRQTSQLKLRLEALGLDGVGGNLDQLQQRLLKAVSELKLADDERIKLTDALVRLSEAALAFEKTTEGGDETARAALVAELRNSAMALGGNAQGAVEGTPVAATLQDGLVISMKDDLALIVANIGRRQGVKVGMPFDVRREQRTIATVRVVDVRDQISGAVIQDLNSEQEPIQVGDHLRVAARP